MRLPVLAPALRMPTSFSPVFARMLFLAALALLGRIGTAAAQEITYKEAREILLQAENTAAEYENLLNAIANTNSGPAEVQLFIDGSYSAGPNQIFLNKNVVVEDNVEPSHTSHDGAQDKPISAYLGDFDVSYVKTDEPSVHFDNRKLGPIRRNDILFVNVLYGNRFASTAKGGGVYRPTQRVMTLRAEKSGNKWHTYIAGVRFAVAQDSSTTPPPDVVVIQKTPEQAKQVAAGKAGEPSGKDVFAEVMQEEARREYAESRQQREKAYSEAMTQGDKALTAEKYEEAAEAYTRAVSINSYDYRARARLQEVERGSERRKLVEAKQTKELEDLLAEATRAQDYAIGKSAAEQLLRRNSADKALQDQLREMELRLNELNQFVAEARRLDYSAAVKFWTARVTEAQKNNQPPARVADLLVYRAIAYVNKNDFKRGLADLSAATQANAVHRPALLARAGTYLKMQEPYKALNDYTLIITNSRFSPIYYKERAAVKMRLRDTVGAVADYDQAIGLDAARPDLYQGRGLLLKARRNYKAAVDDFTKAMELEPAAASHPYERGQTYLAANDVSRAAEDFALARQKGATSDELKTMAALAWERFEKGADQARLAYYSQALVTLTDALLLNPDLVEASLEKGTVQMKMLDYAAAQQSFNQALEARTTYTPVRVARSKVRLLLKNPDGALQDCMAALKQEPLNYSANVALGDVYAAQDRLNDALAQYKKAEAIMDELPLAYLAEGRTLSRAGQYGKAESSLGRAVKYSEKEKTQALPLAELGENALRAHLYKDALSYAEKSLKTGTPMPEAFLVKGRAEVALGQAQQGLSDILRVADKDPDQYYPSARLYSCAAYHRLSQPTRARHELDKLEPSRRQILGPAYLLALADCRLATDSIEGAHALYAQAFSQDNGNKLARYGMARCAARSHDADKALSILRECLPAHPVPKDAVLADPAFTSLATDKRFKALVKEAY